MSNATRIPETRELETESARELLAEIQYRQLVTKSVRRLNAADGFSYVRSIGFQVVLTALPGIIFLVAVAMWTGNETLHVAVEGTLTSLSPGPTADVLTEAVDQAEDRARADILAMIAGGVAALTSGTVAMTQFAEGADRIYGIHRDRPPVRRYTQSLLLALGVGGLFVVAFFFIASGETLGAIVGDAALWMWLRWPIGLVAAVVAISVLYKVAPYRQQPPLAWMLVGGATGTVLWLAASVGLALYLTVSSTFSDLYGPLAGFIGLMFWAQLTGLALLGGLAVSAQLEAERAGVTEVLVEETEKGAVAAAKAKVKDTLT
ncbi:YihY/virulence factor BrkB family protein [soil metagenome]